VAGRPHFLAARSAPEPNSTQSFSVAFHPLRTQHSYAWNGKIPRRSGSLPLKSLNSPPPSLLFQSFAHLLSCNGSFQYFIHHHRHKDDPTFERGITHQDHVMCTSHLNRLGEGLRCSEGGHRRSWQAIGNDVQPADQIPWLAGHGVGVS
jgi:hypothetical protein